MIKSYISRELKIDSTLSYQRFLKKGCYKISKLAVKFKDTTTCPESLSLKNLRKAKLLRLFKKLKFISRIDLCEFQVSNSKFYSSVFFYIAKKLSNVSDLSIYDYRERKANYKGLMTSWPKYMKRLSSFSYENFMEGMDSYMRNPDSVAVEQIIGEMSKQVKLPTDYLRFTPKLKTFRVKFPFFEYNPFLNRIWKYEKCPVSLEKICFIQANCGTKYLPNTSSLARFGKLRDLQIYPARFSSTEFTKSVFGLISQATINLEALSITLIEGFEIDEFALSAIKRLVNLKKVKLRLSLFKHPENLQILESLEECPLQDFSLRVNIKHDSNVDMITNFVNKKKSLKSLKIHITKSELFENENSYIEDLIKAIDDVPLLTSLSLRYQTNKFGNISKKNLLPKMDISFAKLRSKEIPLKKLKVALNQHSYSNEEFLCLLKLYQKDSSLLEKLEIDIGECRPVNEEETEAILDFIKSLKSIKTLKLLGLFISARQFFSEVVEAVYNLKYLRIFCIGEVSGKVAKPFFAGGVEKILLKPGMEKFYCKMSDELKKAVFMRCVNCPDNCVKRIREETPHPKKGLHQIQMFYIDENNSTWKVNE